jgi:hypothetical protein
MIAAAVVAFGKIHQLPADPRQSRRARQFSQLAGDLATMIAAGERRPCFAYGNVHPGNNRATGGPDNVISAIPARPIIKLVTHNPLTDKKN